METGKLTNHLSCFKYDNKERRAIDVRLIEKEQKWELYLEQNKLIFVLEGQVLIKAGVSNEKIVNSGCFCCISACQAMAVKGVTNASILVMRFDNRISLCDCFSMEQLYRKFGTTMYGDIVNEELYTSPIRPRIWHCLQELRDTVGDGIRCDFFLNLKMKEICFLLRAYYTVEELFWIFRPILTNDLTFSDKVMKMWPKYATIRELAHELGYTPSGFYKRFLLVFGVQPQKWVTEQKINAITTDLLASTMSLKDLAHKWNFSDTHAFHNWCRKNLKQSPNSIRGDLRVTSIPEKVSV